MRDEVHDVAVALDVCKIVHIDRAAAADAPEVVAPEVDQHQVLGVLLRVVAQRLLALLILLPRRAARLRPGDRP